MQCSLSNQSWCQATYLFFLVGWVCVNLSFSSSCNNYHNLVSTLPSIDANQLSFPDKEIAAADFRSDCSISSASQQDLQVLLDQNLFSDLHKSFSVWD